jgi:hypothetical protein
VRDVGQHIRTIIEEINPPVERVLAVGILYGSANRGIRGFMGFPDLVRPCFMCRTMVFEKSDDVAGRFLDAASSELRNGRVWRV